MTADMPHGSTQVPTSSSVLNRIAEVRERVDDAKTQASELLVAQKALAQAEIKENIAKPATKGTAMLAVAAVFGLNALTLLFVTAALGIHAAGLPAWASFGIVTAVLLGIAGITAIVGKSAFQQVKPPTKTIDSVKTLQARLMAAMKS